MLNGFLRTEAALFFERRRAYSLLFAIAMIGGPVAYIAETSTRPEATIQVELEPEIKNFAVEEEEEPEVEEEEPPPPPPPNAKIKVVKNPVRRPEVKTPDKKITEVAAETDVEKVVEVAAERSDPANLASRGTKAKDEGSKPGPAATTGTAEKPKPRPKKVEKIDPTKAIDRPANASAPKPLKDNANPEYPKKLRDEGVTGRYVVKLLVYRDGSVRGMKILRKSNTATGSAAQAAADKAFLAEVVKVVKNWKYSPSNLAGTSISVWHTVTIPFTLTK